MYTENHSRIIRHDHGAVSRNGVLLLLVVVFFTAASTVYGITAGNSVSASRYRNASLGTISLRIPFLSPCDNARTAVLSSGKSSALQRKGNQLLSRCKTVLSSLTEKLMRAAYRFKIIALVRKYARKALFLGICTVVILGAISFYRGRYEGKRFMTTTRLSIMDKEVQKACRYIEDNYADPELTLASICRMLVTGEAFLEALFEKELGLTLEAFINQVRINRVKIMLRHTPHADDASLAFSTGYLDEQTLRKVFEQVCGSTVENYRRTLAERGRE